MLTENLIDAATNIYRQRGYDELESIRQSLCQHCDAEGEIIAVSEDESACTIRFDSGELRSVPQHVVLRDMRVRRGRNKIAHHISRVRVGLRILQPDEHGVTLPMFLTALGGDPILSESFFILGDKNFDRGIDLEELNTIWQIFAERESRLSPLHVLSKKLAQEPQQVRPTTAATAAKARRRSTYTQQRKLLKETEHGLFDLAKESIDLLSEALLPSALRSWLLSPDRTVREMAMYLCAGSWLGVSLRGDALTSAYARHPIASLFRGLVHSQPWLIDAISTLPDEKVRALREIFTLLETYALRRSDAVKCPPLHEVLHATARPGVLHWIVHHASVEQRTTFSAVLRSIYTSSIKRDKVKHTSSKYDAQLSRKLGLDSSRWFDPPGSVHAADSDGVETMALGGPEADSVAAATVAENAALLESLVEAKDEEICRLKASLARAETNPDSRAAAVQYLHSLNESLMDLVEANAKQQAVMRAKAQQMERENAALRSSHSSSGASGSDGLSEALMDQCEASAKQQAAMRAKIRQMELENAVLRQKLNKAEPACAALTEANTKISALEGLLLVEADRLLCETSC
jgi:hypothetical protein